MKKKLIIIPMLTMILPIIHACPTCVGRIEPNSPPFFINHYEKTPNIKIENDKISQLFKNINDNNTEETP